MLRVAILSTNLNNSVLIYKEKPFITGVILLLISILCGHIGDPAVSRRAYRYTQLLFTLILALLSFYLCLMRCDRGGLCRTKRNL